MKFVDMSQFKGDTAKLEQWIDIVLYSEGYDGKTNDFKEMRAFMKDNELKCMLTFDDKANANVVSVFKKNELTYLYISKFGNGKENVVSFPSID